MRFDLPKKHEISLEDVPEVVMPVDGRGGVESDVAKHLHANDGVDEEQHHHQHHHIWQRLHHTLLTKTHRYA
jgi:hypothetical protein